MITRPEPDASATARRIAGMGLVPVVAPLLHVQPLAFGRGPAADAVLVTSGNALPCLPARLHGTPLLAVGDATAVRARAAGFSRVASASGDAGALLALVQASQPPGALLLLATARHQGGALAGQLRAAGYRVHRRAVYAAIPAARLPQAAAAALRTGSLRAALFLSAETARTFVRLLHPSLHPALAGIEALAIGQPAADVLAPLPWKRVRVSVTPTLDDVLALL